VTESGDASSGVVPGSPEDFNASQNVRVFFETNKHFISNEAARTLRQQARWLRKYPEKRIIIEGNCDERGTREYNYALGNRRALSVRDFLISQGIPSYRIRTVSYGKDKPEFIGSNKTAWALNRRAVTVIAN
jgi:peptidoglycan-associated lipoprotein